MKAIVINRYGSPDVLKMREVAKPVPKDNEVLIRIHATAVTSGDSRLRGFNFPGHVPTANSHYVWLPRATQEHPWLTICR